jgi:thioredoxin 1
VELHCRFVRTLQRSITMSVPEIQSADFGVEVLTSDLPVLVDFFATWCGPCKMMAPSLDVLSDELEGRVKVVKVDVDANPDLAQLYGVQGVPTLAVFRGGEVLAQQSGAKPKAAIARLVSDSLEG